MNPTAIIGATTNPDRYAFLAAEKLTKYGHEIIPIGIRKGEVCGKTILDLREKPDPGPVDTVTLYLGPQNQTQWRDYIVSLKPRRVIFNPGTENSEFEKQLSAAGIEPVRACTLVMLGTGQY